MNPFFNKLNFRSKYELTKSWPENTIAKAFYNDFSKRIHFQIFIPDLTTILICELKTLEYFENWLWMRYNKMQKCQHSFNKVNLDFTDKICSKCDYFRLEKRYIDKIKLAIQSANYGISPEVLEIEKYSPKYNECY